MYVTITDRKAIDAIVGTFRRKPKEHVERININVCDGEDTMFPTFVKSNGRTHFTWQKCYVEFFIEDDCSFMLLTQASTQRTVRIQL